MLIAIFGNVGTGKTLFASILGHTLFQLGRRVIANYGLADSEEFNLQTFIKNEYPSSVIILDEGYVYLDSRVSMNRINRTMSYSLFQSRKNDLTIILTAQLSQSIDVRFRKLIDVCVLCERTAHGFKYTIQFIGKNRILHKYLTQEKAKIFFPLYNTLEVVTDDNLHKLAERIESGPEKMKRYERYLEKIPLETTNSGLRAIFLQQNWDLCDLQNMWALVQTRKAATKKGDDSDETE